MADSFDGVSSPAIRPTGAITDPYRVGAQATSMANPYEVRVHDYDTTRPNYHPRALQLVAHWLSTTGTDTAHLLDIGCGSGTFTRQLLTHLSRTTADLPHGDTHRPRGQTTRQSHDDAHLPHGTIHAIGVDPSPAMGDQFDLPGADFICAPAEDMPLPDNSIDVAVCAQAWHWCDPVAAGHEVARVMRPDAPFFIIFNQLNVGIGWIKRLSRIMRSGDVHHPDKPPSLPNIFAPPHLSLFSFAQTLLAKQVIRLGMTRSSYLRASQAGRAHMTANLTWYLYDHMGFDPDEPVELPYMTLVWHTAVRRG